MKRLLRLKAAEPSIWNASFINMFITNILLHLCIYMMNTLSATYADYLGAGSLMVGVASSVFALTALLFKIISAPAVDTFNRKHILQGAIGILMISYIGYALSGNVTSLLVSRLLTGTGMAFTATCCMTIASDALPVAKMATGIGYFSLGTALCQAIAPTLGLKLVEMFGYRPTFWILAGVLLTAILFVSTLKFSFTRTKQFKISWKSVIAREALVPAVLLFLLTVSFSVLNTFLVLFAGERGINSNIGYFFTVYAVTMLFTRPFIGKMTDKYGLVKTVIPSMLCFMLSFVVISCAHNLAVFLFAGFVSAFGYGGSLPALQAACMKSVPPERRGSASSTSYIGTDVGNLMGPIISGAIVEKLGYVSMWRIMLLPIAAGIVIICFAERRKNDRNP